MCYSKFAVRIIHKLRGRGRDPTAAGPHDYGGAFPVKNLVQKIYRSRYVVTTVRGVIFFESFLGHKISAQLFQIIYTQFFKRIKNLNTKKMEIK